MFVLRILLVAICIALLPAATAMTAEQDTVPAEGQIDEKARDAVARSVKFLTNLKQLRMSAEFGFDVLQDNGQMLEFGSHQDITVQRPDHFRIEVDRRDGASGNVVYDGKEIVLFNPEHAVYAKAPFTGEIDDAFDFLAEKLQRPVPLRDFFASDLEAILLATIESGLYIEESTVAGVLCDHVALRNDNVDYQIWIAKGDEPLPRRMIITHKNEKGWPQFWAQFQKWDLSPKIADGDFIYDPPENAERIPVAELDERVPEEGGQL